MKIAKTPSIEEWKELLEVPAIREAWGLTHETPEQFVDLAFGVKFDLAPMTMPGYVGNLYILSGDALGEPFTLIRENGKLTIVQIFPTLAKLPAGSVDQDKQLPYLNSDLRGAELP